MEKRLPKPVKTNKKFMLLSAMAICMVVDAHSGAFYPIGALTVIFPYGSFFMPLFVFVSGYFFSAEHVQSFRALGQYLWKQTKKLLLTYYVVNIAVIGVVLGIQHFNPNLHWYGTFDWKWFLIGAPLSVGYEIDVLFPYWFATALFFVIMIYHILRKLSGRFWNEWILFAILFVIGIMGVHYGSLITNNGSWQVGFCKTLILVQFYEFGILYRKYLEERLKRVPFIALILAPVLLNTMIQTVLESEIDYGGLVLAKGYFISPVVPVLTSYSGILFYTAIADFLSGYDKISDSRVINYISSHTMQMMIMHLPFMNVFSWLIMHMPGVRERFDDSMFLSGSWYKYVFTDISGKPSRGGISGTCFLVSQDR